VIQVAEKWFAHLTSVEYPGLCIGDW
jgi:hypothetical protein